ncbi:hypothetical protein HRW23_04955 [Streptomyces lunaelactis]|uniref:hypothetical protein n=1 Tax=Streptomyces lunaelactis TaxID=1535768 RepID=UPI0015856E22|nr:hypothetical protein [Streptomyces lunaelactis]NUK01390.1 hypothetical protein [Streptomyces lunaelactis]NUK08248.1 hypothetical protein [Streptomyces lunaelactis]NUK15355.1 hypothetical protein [Streptomyces lunaelactis]NUK22583.1 hypothetical protein [Streptomyces lunaelactis]NUK32581.1 hypothetical protein [Streptomyces lunaelactis]
MSFGQGGPQWSPGGQNEDPYGGQNQSPYGGQNQGPYGGQGQDPYGGQRQDPYNPFPAPPDPFGLRATSEADNTPDWASLAEAAETRTRRKRWLLVGGGVLATAAIAGIVATAIVSSNSDDSNRAGDKNASELPAPPDLPGGTTEPEPSFSSVAPLPPPNPKDFISSEKKDTAPLSVDTLFPGKKLTMTDRVYGKGATARTGTCASATQGGLGSILEANGCDQVFRATYSKDGIAVTVGVAVFGAEAEAKKAAQQAQGNVTPLPGAGVPTFCKGGPVCRFTANSYGRYAYFTATGYTKAKSVTSGDSKAFQTGDDLAEFTFRQIVRRGEAQASAAATAPAG